MAIGRGAKADRRQCANQPTDGGIEERNGPELSCGCFHHGFIDEFDYLHDFYLQNIG
jgi:hypothetical protein